MKKNLYFLLFLTCVSIPSFAKSVNPLKESPKVDNCSQTSSYSSMISVTCPGTGEVKTQMVTAYYTCTKATCGEALACAQTGARYEWNSLAPQAKTILLSQCTVPD